MPGVVDPASGAVALVSTLSLCSDLSVPQVLAEHFGREVGVENDVISPCSARPGRVAHALENARLPGDRHWRRPRSDRQRPTSRRRQGRPAKSPICRSAAISLRRKLYPSAPSSWRSARPASCAAITIGRRAPPSVRDLFARLETGDSGPSPLKATAARSPWRSPPRVDRRSGARRAWRQRRHPSGTRPGVKSGWRGFRAPCDVRVSALGASAALVGALPLAVTGSKRAIRHVRRAPGSTLPASSLARAAE